MICLINQEARRAAFLVVNVKDFFEKGGEKIKMESQKAHKYRLRDSERLLNTKGSFSISKEVLFIVVLFLMI